MSVKQAVAERDLNYVLVGDPRRSGYPRNRGRPSIEILLGISRHDRLAGGSRRSVDPRDILLRLGEQSERIVVPHIVFGRKRQILDILKALYRIGRDPRLVEFVFVKLDVVIRLVYRILQTFELDLFYLLMIRATFNFLIPNFKHFLLILLTFS